MTVKSEYQYPDEIIIGTRGSPLALAQTEIVKKKIDSIGQDISVKVQVINTSGEWRPDQGEVRLNSLEGGKAQFAKEIEEALLEGVIDIGVHSMKDMETVLPEGLVMPYMLPREDVRDAFLSEKYSSISDLPEGSVVGTASVRRQAFLLKHRPDVRVVPLRGNVQTRIDKMRSGQVDATFLACAGLNRLGLQDEIRAVLSVDEMLPAVGQGAIGLQVRSADSQKMSFLSQFSCEKTVLCVECERGVLRALGGSCHTPVGVHAWYDQETLSVRVEVISDDGASRWSESDAFTCHNVEDSISFGENVGARLRPKIPSGVL